jgi:mannose-6-phosphate isomerase-like protein (cupin superfamily)
MGDVNMTDTLLGKAIHLLQKSRDMSLDYSGAKICLDAAIARYASEDYQNTESFAGQVIDLLLSDIKARRSDVNRWRIRRASRLAPVMLDNGVQLWALFNGGSIGGLISPDADSCCEYTGLVGEMLIDGGATLSLQKCNMEVFYFVLNGEGIISIDGQDMPIHTGDWVFVPNNWSHSIRSGSRYYPLGVFVFSSYLDRRTSELLPVGTDPLSVITPPTPHAGSATEAMEKLSAIVHEAEKVGISADIGGSLYREADFYIELAQRCFGRSELGVRKYTASAISLIQKYIEDIKRWDSYKSDITRLRANITTFPGEWLHEASSIDWFVFADEIYMKPEWNRPITPYTPLEVEWEVPAGKSFMPHTHNTEEIYYQMASVTGMKIGPVGTNKFAGDEEEFFLYPGDCLFIPANTKHVARSVSCDYPLHAIAVDSYSDEILTGEAAIY